MEYSGLFFPDGREEIFIATKVIRFVVWLRSQHHADCTLAEGIDFAPDEAIDIEPSAWVSQPVFAALASIINGDPEAARERKDHLLEGVVRVPATL